VEHRVLGVYGKSLWFFLHHRWVSMLIWVICLAGTGYLVYVVPKGFLPIGDSSFVRGVLIAPEGASPEQMHGYQVEAEDALHKSDSVDMTFTATGISQFLSSNQGFLLAFLKDPAQRPPLQLPGPDGKLTTIEHPTIEQVSAQLMGLVAMQAHGTFAILQPNPVLQISTGATANQTGQFSYSLSGVNPQDVYKATGLLMARLGEQQGKLFKTLFSDLFMHTPNLRINILRDKAASYGVSATRIETLLRNAYSENYVYLIKKPEDQY